MITDWNHHKRSSTIVGVTGTVLVHTWAQAVVAWCPVQFSKSATLLHDALYSFQSQLCCCMMPCTVFKVGHVVAWCPVQFSKSATLLHDVLCRANWPGMPQSADRFWWLHWVVSQAIPGTIMAIQVKGQQGVGAWKALCDGLNSGQCQVG